MYLEDLTKKNNKIEYNNITINLDEKAVYVDGKNVDIYKIRI